MYDVIVIGNGPAGISAAIYTLRANLKTAVIGKDGGALEKADIIQNYYGIEQISGKELVSNGINQAKKLGAEYINEEVVALESKDDIFKVVTNLNEYLAKAVVIATGALRNVSSINGLKEFEGKGVSYCAMCDAFFFKDKDVAVLGNGSFAMHEILELLPVVNTVSVLTNGKEKLNIREEKVKVFDKNIKKVNGTDRLEKVEFEDNTDISVDGVFVAEGVATSIDFARRIGAEIKGNNIVVDNDYMTSVSGLFAAGDCIGGLLQVSKAVADGAKAGVSVINYLRGKK